MVSHQIEDINKETEIIKKRTKQKSEIEKYNNLNEKITRGAPQQI